MNNFFDQMLSAQNDMMNAWTKMQKNIAETAKNGSAKAATEQEKKSTDWMEWMKSQQNKLAEIMKPAEGKNVMEMAPEKIQQWMDWQTEYAENWLNYMRENGNKMGINLPEKGETPADYMKRSMKESETAAKQTRNWMKDNMFHLMPEQMKSFYNQYEVSYDQMEKHWSDIRKMIEWGVTNWNGISKFYSPELFSDFISKYTGMSSMKDMDAMMEQNRKMMQQFTDMFSNQKLTGNMMEMWKNWIQEMKKSDFAPAFQFGIDMNQSMREQLEPWYNMMQPGKEEKMIRIFSDIQFGYAAYLTKSMQLHHIVMEGTKDAMPKTIEHFSNKFKTDKTMPGFQEFYNTFVNHMETLMTEVLKSKEYSTLQGDMAATGSKVKLHMDAMSEIMLEGTPFVTRNMMDDVSKETSALRSKIRSLENKLNTLETAIAKAAASKKEPAKATTTTKAASPAKAKTEKV